MQKLIINKDVDYYYYQYPSPVVCLYVPPSNVCIFKLNIDISDKSEYYIKIYIINNKIIDKKITIKKEDDNFVSLSRFIDLNANNEIVLSFYVNDKSIYERSYDVNGSIRCFEILEDDE